MSDKWWESDPLVATSGGAQPVSEKWWESDPLASPDATASADPASRFQFVPPEAAGMMIEPETQGMDVAKSFGSGAVKGVIGMGTLPHTLGQLAEAGGNYIGAPEWATAAAKSVASRATMPVMPAAMEKLLPSNQQMTEAFEKHVTPLHKPQTTAGRYAQTTGEFAAGGFTPGGVVRKVANVVAPAVASETAGQILEGSDYEQAGRVVGGIVGGSLPNLARRVRTPFPMHQPERAKGVAVLEAEGVPLSAGDKTGQRALQWAESTAQDMPGAGQRLHAMKEVQAEKFMTKILKKAGIDAPRFTDDVADAAFSNYGTEFGNIARAVDIPLRRSIMVEVSRSLKAYERLVPPSMASPLPRKIFEDLKAMQKSGRLAGDQYGEWRSQLGAVARGTKDPTTKDAVYQLQKILDTAAEASLRLNGNVKLADRMQQLRRDYRNLLVLTEAKGTSADNSAGLLSPKDILRAARRMEGGKSFARGRGDMTELASAANAVIPKLAQSGTQPRTLSQALFTLPANIVGGATAMSAGMLPAAAAAGASLASMPLMARGLMSKRVQSWLGNQTMAKAIKNSNARTPFYIGAQPIAQPRDERK